MHSKPMALDNSGIVHLAVFPDGKPNLFRINYTFDEPLQPEHMQKALDNICPRFPSIVAGIRPGFFHHRVVPAAAPPKLRADEEIFALMSKKELGQCGIRLLYKGCRLTLECFHSLTDGSGGIAFMNALAAEYLRLRGLEDIEGTSCLLLANDPPAAEELEDAYLRYAGDKKLPLESRASYQLPGPNLRHTEVYPTLGIFKAADVLQKARENGVTVAAFMTAAMASAVMEIQQKHRTGSAKLRPVQIMVPADLRRLFPSKTLRNFSLYALAAMTEDMTGLDFSSLAKSMAGQIREQLSPETLSAMMATNASLHRKPLLRYCPLFIKLFVIRMGYRIWGAKTSCLTLTNLGVLSIPEPVKKHVARADLLLTPRIYSPYNCGMISYKDELIICLSRNCPEAELEEAFFKKLKELGLEGRVEVPV